MHNRRVFVTGSSRGIGLAAAKAFGLLGAKVAINCRKSENELCEAAVLLSDMGADVTPIIGDVSDYEICRNVVEAAVEAIGEIDILINNAGVSGYGLFTEQTPSEIRRIMDVNQFSVINCTHLILPSMIKRKKGHIINISSVWGVKGASCEVIYSASKGFVNTFTKALARETSPSNVLINAIACGVIDTEMNNCFTAEEKEDLKNQIGLMRLGTPEDVAGLCLYLAQTLYMTGQVLTLDGGLI